MNNIDSRLKMSLLNKGKDNGLFFLSHTLSKSLFLFSKIIIMSKTKKKKSTRDTKRKKRKQPLRRGEEHTKKR